VETYQRRYLWVTAMEIVEHDALDSVTGADDDKAARTAPKKPAKPQVTDAGLDMARSALEACRNLQELKETFVGLPVHVREAVTSVKDSMKAKLEKAA
jgi:hypothetical protein